MRHVLPVLAAVLAIVTLQIVAVRIVPADVGCTGSSCLAIGDIKFGTRCHASDSIEATATNLSSSVLRGAVVFTSRTGRIAQATGPMVPGQKSVFFACHGSGEAYGIVDAASNADDAQAP